MTKLKTLLVGSHFVPPAKILLEHLKGGTPLTLVREPENPYDDHAVKVYCKPSDVPLSQREELALKLPGTGNDWEEMLASNAPVCLGHLSSNNGKPILKARLVDPELVGNLDCWEHDELFSGEAPVFLHFDGTGMTLVVGEIENE